MNNKITTNMITTTGINITKYNTSPAKVFINDVEVTDIESWNKALGTFRELQDKINNLQFKIDKAIEYIEKDILNNKIEKVDWDFDECYFSDMPVERIKPLINILKENNNDN